ncbi:DUF2505 domain-containing protein [Nakamurella deserti]|uniref:DUF2505 domain-containing protein n=1 Tax=Nakamurella deserti TaxID=2164074 RepID=UPI00130097DE|nr:DUF2505 domain-containing protein [Nakamurella deserti]
MPTTFTATQRYPAPATAVYALFSDRGFLEARLAATGGLDPQVMSLDLSDDGGVVVVTRQGIPASKLPSVVASFINGDLSTQRTESWRPAADGYTADLKVTIHGAPASMKGTMTLSDDPTGGSVLTVLADATVPIPMFGGKVEKVVVEQVGELLDREEAFTREQLAG